MKIPSRILLYLAALICLDDVGASSHGKNLRNAQSISPPASTEGRYYWGGGGDDIVAAGKYPSYHSNGSKSSTNSGNNNNSNINNNVNGGAGSLKDRKKKATKKKQQHSGRSQPEESNTPPTNGISGPIGMPGGMLSPSPSWNSWNQHYISSKENGHFLQNLQFLLNNLDPEKRMSQLNLKNLPEGWSQSTIDDFIQEASKPKIGQQKRSIPDCKMMGLGLGRLVLGDPVSRGSCNMVRYGRDALTNARFVVKIYADEETFEPKFTGFLNEFTALTMLSHENIIRPVCATEIDLEIPEYIHKQQYEQPSPKKGKKKRSSFHVGQSSREIFFGDEQKYSPRGASTTAKWTGESSSSNELLQHPLQNPSPGITTRRRHSARPPLQRSQTRSYAAMVLELVQGTRSEDYVYNLGQTANKEPHKYEKLVAELVNIIAQLFALVTFFHQNNLIHNDLKPEDLLIYNPAEDVLIDNPVIHNDLKPEDVLIDNTGRVRMVDFDHMTDRKYAYPFYGSNITIAPEKVNHVKGAIDFGSDFWSLGSTILSLMSNFIAGFRSMEDNENLIQMYADYYPFIYEPALKSYRIQPLPQHIPASWTELVYIFFAPDPADRHFVSPVELENIRRLPFFKGVNWDSILNPTPNPPFLDLEAIVNGVNNRDPSALDLRGATSHDNILLCSVDARDTKASKNKKKKPGFTTSSSGSGMDCQESSNMHIGKGRTHRGRSKPPSRTRI